MKRMCFYSFFLLLCMLIMLSHNCKAEEDVLQGKLVETPFSYATASMPLSLCEIEESAFEGTAFWEVKIPEKVKKIGSRAFAEIPTLRLINIPVMVEEISDYAFENDFKIIICGLIGGEVREWAMRQGYPFMPIASLKALTTPIDIYTNHNNVMIVELVNRKTRNQETVSPSLLHAHRTGRNAGELKASHFKGRAAQHIQSRYFP